MIRLAFVAVFAIALWGGASVSSAATISYFAQLDGPSEFPSNGSPGTGTAQVDYDDVAHTLRVQTTFSDLNGTVTAAHIHSPIPPPPADPVAAVATQLPTFSGFPSGVMSGTYDNTFDLTDEASWNPSFITDNGGTPAGAEAALAASLADGTAYLNIHTTEFGGGEIRGFLFVPEPAAIGLFTLGGLALLFGHRQARRQARRERRQHD